MEITHLSYSSLKEAKEDKPTNPFKVFTEGPDGKIDASIVGFAQDETDQLQILVENKDLWEDVFLLVKISHAHYLYELYGFDPLGMDPDNQFIKFIKDYFKAFKPNRVEGGPKIFDNWDELVDEGTCIPMMYDSFSKGSQCTRALKQLLVETYNDGIFEGWIEQCTRALKQLLVETYNDGIFEGWIERYNRMYGLETEILDEDEWEDEELEDDIFQIHFKDFFLD